MWKILTGICDSYRISDLGYVQRMQGITYVDKFIHETPNRNPRLKRNYIQIQKDNKSKIFYIDELVALYFLNLPLGTNIYHKDLDYTNNCLSNLTTDYVFDTTLPSLEGEEWRPVPGYEDRYKISNYGRCMCSDFYCYSNRVSYSRILQPTVNDSYLYYNIYDYDSKNWRTFPAHRLVALAFLPTPANFEMLEVNHKDFNPQNNNVINLEWCTRLENIRYSSSRGRFNNRKHPEARICGMLKGIPVYCTNTGKLYLRWTDAEDDLGLWNGAVKNCLSKGVKSHGFSFRTVDKHSDEYRQAFLEEFHKYYPSQQLEDYRKYFESADMLYLLE